MFALQAQIRTGFYYHFIMDWLEVFKKEQFLFVEFKEYVVDEAGYITDVILPFLNMGKQLYSNIPQSKVLIVRKEKKCVSKVSKKYI